MKAKIRREFDMEKKENLVHLLKNNKQFRILWIGQFISQLGDAVNWMANLAFVTIIAPVIGTSFLLLWLSIPIVIIGPIAGVIADRISRKLLLLLTDLTRAISILIFVLFLTNVISVKSDVQIIHYSKNKVVKEESIVRESLSKNEKISTEQKIKIQVTDSNGNKVEQLIPGKYKVSITGNFGAGENTINTVISTTTEDYEKIELKRKDVQNNITSFVGEFTIKETEHSKKKNGMVDINNNDGTIEISYLEKQGPIFIIYLITFILSVITQFYVPAKSALIPEIVDKEYLIYANSLSATTYKIVMIFGGSLGGFIIKHFGIINAFWFDVATYLISFCTILFIKEKHFHIFLQAKTKVEKNFKEEFKEGLKFIIERNIVAFAVLRYIIIMAAGGIMYIFMINYSNETLQMGVEGAGYLQTSLGIGIVIGSFMLTVIGNKISKLTMIRIGFAIVGSAMIGFAFVENIYLAFLVGMLGGIGSGLIIVLSETILQVVVPVNIRGRIFGILQTLTNSAFAIFAILTGMIFSNINEKEVFLTLGFALFMVDIVSLAYIRIKKLRGEMNGKDI